MEQTAQTKYELALEKARIRQKRWYAKNVKKVSDKKKEQRVLFKQLKESAGLVPEPEPEVIPEPEPETEPVEVGMFNTFSKNEYNKIKKTNNSKSDLNTILTRLKSFSQTGSKDSFKTYKTNVEQLYALTKTDKNKAINLNNVESLFKILDEFKKPNGQEYGIDKKFNTIHIISILADPTNNFGLNVDKKAYEIFKQKHEEFKILKKDKQTNKKQKEVPMFSEILQKAKSHFGLDSEFFLYLSLFNIAPMRDDFELEIVGSVKEAKSEKKNYIIIPTKKNLKGYMIFNSYKTANKYEKITRELPNTQLNMVKEFMKTNNLEANKGQYLFGTGQMSLYVGKKLKEIGIEEKGGNISLLRHAISTEWNTTHKNSTARERLEFSKIMGHSPNMNIEYVRKTTV